MYKKWFQILACEPFGYSIPRPLRMLSRLLFIMGDAFQSSLIYDGLSVGMQDEMEAWYCVIFSDPTISVHCRPIIWVVVKAADARRSIWQHTILGEGEGLLDVWALLEEHGKNISGLETTQTNSIKLGKFGSGWSVRSIYTNGVHQMSRMGVIALSRFALYET